jgi:hypothetical protein
MRVGQPDSYPLATALLTAAAWAALRAWRSARWQPAAASGIALGLGALVRPSMASVTIVWVLFGLMAIARSRVDRGRRTALLAVGVVAWALCVVPIAWSNASAGAGMVLSTNNEVNVFLGNNPFTPHYKTGELARSLKDDPVAFQEYLTALLPHGLGGFALAEDRRRLMHETATYMVEHPWITLLRTTNRVRAFWGVEYNGSRQIQEAYALSRPQAAALLALEGGGFFLIGLCAWLALLHASTRRDGSAFLAATMAAYAAPYFVSFAIGLQHTTLVPIVIVLAAAFVVRVRRAPAPWRLLRSRRVLIAALFWSALQAEYLFWVLRYSHS